MDDQRMEKKQRDRKKIIVGLLLSLIVFAWFLYYLVSHIPG